MTKSNQQKNLIESVVGIVVGIAFVGLFVWTIFADFMTLKISGGTSFDILLDFVSKGTKTNLVCAVCACVFLSLSALLLVVSKIATLAKASEKLTKILKTVCISVALVAFLVCYPAMISLQMHYFVFNKAVATMTVFFVLNLVWPVLYVAYLTYDCRDLLKAQLFDKTSVKDTFVTTMAYPVLALLAMVTFVLPVYQYTSVSGENVAVYTKQLSLFGANSIDAIIAHRTALAVVAVAVLSIVTFVANWCVANAKNNDLAKKFRVAKFVRLASSCAMILVLLYCVPSIISYMQECAQDLSGFTGETFADVAKGFSFYAIIGVPVLALVCAIADAVHEFQHIDDRLAKVKTKLVESTNWQLTRSVFQVFYVVVLLALIVSLALPYASYHLVGEGQAKLFSFIMLYSGVSDKGYAGGVPATNDLFVYAMLIGLLAIASLAVMIVAKPSKSKIKTIVPMVVKLVCTVVYSVVFWLMNGMVSFYKEQFVNTANTFDLSLSLGLPADLIGIVAVGYLIFVWIDFVVFGYRFLQENKSLR